MGVKLSFFHGASRSRVGIAPVVCFTRNQISVLFLLSYMCSIAFNISNKQALLLVPLPWTYAALNLAIGGGMGLVSWGVKAAPWPKVNLAVRRSGAWPSRARPLKASPDAA